MGSQENPTVSAVSAVSTVLEIPSTTVALGQQAIKNPMKVGSVRRLNSMVRTTMDARCWWRIQPVGGVRWRKQGEKRTACPKPGHGMRRDVRPMAYVYKGHSAISDWGGTATNAVRTFTREPMEASSQLLRCLKARERCFRLRIKWFGSGDGRRVRGSVARAAESARRIYQRIECRAFGK